MKDKYDSKRPLRKKKVSTDGRAFVMISNHGPILPPNALEKSVKQLGHERGIQK